MANEPKPTSDNQETPLRHAEGTPTDASTEGNFISSPAVNPNDIGRDANVKNTPQSAADVKSEKQMLTGHAARAFQQLEKDALSPAQLTWREFRKNRLAVAGGVILLVLYVMALMAQFLSPYDPQSQNPGVADSLSYHPPMKLRFKTAQGGFSWRPFVYQTSQSYTEDRDLIYLPEAEQPRVVQWFVQGEPYKLFGFIPMKTRLFGVNDGYIYVLGTDEFGRDYFSRLLYGSQISLSVGLIAIFITFSLGMLVGGISGFYGGRIDEVIMRLCEIMMSVPDFYLLLALAAALPVTLNPILVYVLIIVILSFIGWAGMARVIRGMVLSVREREYVEAARALGINDFTIVLRHILPSTFTYAIVAATMSVPGYILGEAGLSFLGLGIRDPMASWGNMLSAAQNLTTIEDHRWILAPGVMIFITTLAFNFLGDGLRDALDPKSRRL